MRKVTKQQELGLRIAAARQESGLTQADAADRVGVHRLSWSRWERGEQVPDALLLARISEALQVSADELLGLGQNTDR